METDPLTDNTVAYGITAVVRRAMDWLSGDGATGERVEQPSVGVHIEGDVTVYVHIYSSGDPHLPSQQRSEGN